MDNGSTYDAAFLRRYWVKVDKNGPIPEYRPDLGPCWIWTAATDTPGYGRIWTGSKRAGTRRLGLAHRISHEIHIGPIPAKFHVDHLCRVPGCVNPAHLEAVTHQVNIARGLTPQRNRERGRAQTHCRRAGHEFTPENTRLNRAGARECITCTRELDRNLQRAKRAAKRMQAIA